MEIKIDVKMLDFGLNTINVVGPNDKIIDTYYGILTKTGKFFLTEESGDLCFFEDWDADFTAFHLEEMGVELNIEQLELLNKIQKACAGNSSAPVNNFLFRNPKSPLFGQSIEYFYDFFEEKITINNLFLLCCAKQNRRS
ncbi:hypothetical protein KKH36_01055 [Patescibacteria group bacterium]|nr:hypothetical protein [Patescibacteria group bacterium]